MKKWTTKTVVTLGLLIALQVVLSRFVSLNTWNLKIGFAFVPVALAGMLYGPFPAAVVGGLSDILGALLFPNGPYYPGFTITAILLGLVYGWTLHTKRSFLRVLLAALLSQGVLSLTLNTLWISLLYHSPYWVTFTGRLIQCLPMAAVEMAVLTPIGKLADRLKERERK